MENIKAEFFESLLLEFYVILFAGCVLWVLLGPVAGALRRALSGAREAAGDGDLGFRDRFGPAPLWRGARRVLAALKRSVLPARADDYEGIDAYEDARFGPDGILQLPTRTPRAETLATRRWAHAAVRSSASSPPLPLEGASVPAGDTDGGIPAGESEPEDGAPEAVEAPPAPPEAPRASGSDDERARRRELRIARAQGAERVRSAMRRLAGEGFYVFEDLLTVDAGAIDGLAIGPTGVFLLVIDHESDGTVSREEGTGALLVDGASPAEDLDALADELSEDLQERLTGENGPLYTVICFTRAEPLILESASGTKLRNPVGTTSVWHLVFNLTYDNLPHVLSPGLVEELAQSVELLYEKAPYVVPDPDGRDAGDDPEDGR